MMLKIRLLLVFPLIFPFFLPANGFKFFAWEPRGIGLAGALIARSQGPEALFYNPAGMVNQPGSAIYLGGFCTSRRYSFSTPDQNINVDSDRAGFLIPSLAATHQISNKLWLGLGVYSPTSYKIRWPVDQRHPLVYGTRESELMFYNVSAGIAWKAGKRISLGGSLGLNFSRGDFTTHYDFDFIMVNLSSGRLMDAEDFILEAKDCRKTSLALNLGLQWEITGRIRFGLSVYGDLGSIYQVGRINFMETDTPFPEINAFLATYFRDSPDQKATFQNWDVPSIKAGIAWRITDSFSLEIAVFYDFWYVLDGIELVLDPMIYWPGTLRMEKEEVNYQSYNTLSVSLGGEVRLSDQLTLRLGAFIDPGPIPDETLSSAFPFADQWGIALGLGYRSPRVSLDLAYRWLKVEAIKVSNDRFEYWGITRQEYAGRNEHLFSIGMGYRF